MLVKRGRVSLHTYAGRWTEEALETGDLCARFEPKIAVESVVVAETVRKDPSGRILILCARVERFEAVTRDTEIIESAERTQLPHLRA